ncbi:hypothetical protein BDC45DRAFT_210863 [Circinella umbellata]|nr:hypothetical protein BDC45DRAFT_210863 [Circinella umbellata]
MEPRVAYPPSSRKYKQLHRSWHRHLKEVYLPSLRRQRVDVLVYILWSLVLPDLMQDHLCTVAKFKLRRMNKAERARLARVNELNDEEAYAKIVGQEGNIIKVLSFTDPDESTVYDVLINVDDDFLESCTCLDQQTNDSPCKHMYLVNRVFNISLIRPQASSSSSSSSLPPPPSSPSPSSSQQQQQLDVVDTDLETGGDLSQEALDRYKTNRKYISGPTNNLITITHI